MTKTLFGSKSEFKLRGKVASKALVVGATRDVKRNEYLIAGIGVDFGWLITRFRARIERISGQ